MTPPPDDRVPCVYVENHRVANLDAKDPITVSYKGPFDDQPTGKSNPQLLKMKPSNGQDMTIVKSALWNDDRMADVLTQRAEKFIAENHTRPFFLYFGTHDIHVPRVPHDRFSAATRMGPRGNLIAELDWSFGRIVQTLEKHKLLQDTLIIVSTDNGGSCR